MKFNYKKIIKSRSLRIKILSLLAWVPDIVMIPLQYRIHTGRKCNLKHPKRFTEKLQIYKLTYRNSLMLRCTDKFEVRKVIKELGYAHLLIPLVGVYDNVESLDFEVLPKSFVIKTTDGGGGNRVFICKDKDSLDKEEFIAMLHMWMKGTKGKPAGREWAYENKYPRRIIVEALISEFNERRNDENIHNEQDLGLIDYKFFCFNGKVGFIYVISKRKIGIGGDLGIYTRDWTKLNVIREDEFPAPYVLPRPENFNEMVKIAEDIAQNFPHVRVDLYNVNSKVYFGELTFYDGSGYMKFKPDSFDIEAGTMFKLDYL